MFLENVHVPYKNFEANPCNSSRKILSTTEISQSGYDSDNNAVIDFHINCEQLPAIDVRRKHFLCH